MLLKIKAAKNKLSPIMSPTSSQLQIASKLYTPTESHVELYKGRSNSSLNVTGPFRRLILPQRKFTTDHDPKDRG